MSIYNEDTVIKGLTTFGYPLEEAREFTNDGCWEAIIPGKTAFIYTPSDMMPVLSTTLKIEENEEVKDFDSFESLYEEFKNNLRLKIDSI